MEFPNVKAAPIVIQACWTADQPATAAVVSTESQGQAVILTPGRFSTPDDLLNASLAVSATLRMAKFVKRAKLSVSVLKAEVAQVHTQSGRLLTMAIVAIGTLTNRQQEALRCAANRCLVHKALTGGIRVVILERLSSADRT
jgi:uncharacterized OsmC-like protein